MSGSGPGSQTMKEKVRQTADESQASLKPLGLSAGIRSAGGITLRGITHCWLHEVRLVVHPGRAVHLRTVKEASGEAPKDLTLTGGTFPWGLYILNLHFTNKCKM